MKNSVEFKPPSDFVDDSGGGGSNNVWKYVGIGCGVILLIVGIAFAFGAWKTASCCGDIVDAGKYTMKAGQSAQSFANKISQGDVKGAYSQTSESFQSRVSKQQFQAQLQKHASLLKSSAPRQANFTANTPNQQKQGEVTQPTSWNATYEFAGADSKKKLVMTIELLREGEGEEAKFLVDDMRLEQRKRVLSAEPPAETIADFHRKVQRGSYDLAYNLMAPEYSTSNDRSSFNNFLDEHEDAYLGSDPEVVAVNYAAGATVVVRTVGNSGASWEIEYTLTKSFGPQGWSISAISPMKRGGGQPVESNQEGQEGTESGEQAEDGEGAAGDEKGDESAGKAGEDDSGESADDPANR